MKKRIVLSILLSMLFVLPSAVWASDFDTLVVFGDSLSDDGNLYGLDPSLVPADIYYQGRFSNGPVWVEYLAGEDFLDCALVDHAWVGAGSGDAALPPGLLSQVGDYTASATLGANTLFVIWCGANDFLDGSLDYQATADNIGEALDALAAFGAEDIMVVNLPDLGATPRFLGTTYEDGARSLAQAFNNALADVIDSFQTANPGVSVYELDSFAYLQAVAADPGSYGFSNATQVCPAYDDDVAGNFDNSGGYLFWDEIHPTTEGHEALAEQALTILPDNGDSGDDDDDDDDGDSDGSCFIGSMLYIDYRH